MTPQAMGETVRVLVVEDDPRLLRIITRHLERMGYGVQCAANAVLALELVRRSPVDIVLSDVRMPGMDGHELLITLRKECPDTKVVLMTAFGSIEAAVEAMTAGAYSYVCKPFKVEEIAAVLRNASREIVLRRQVNHLTSAVRVRYHADRLVGSSRQMREVRRQVREVAPVAATVLITGRSGTGKELVARAIHFEGPRAAGPLVPVNCSAIPQSIFESEMFGHRRGAFSGADQDQQGLIGQSSGGTLFLDEVGEIPLRQQPKLLRVLEDRQVRPLGGGKPVHVDLRVIAATNRPLDEMVQRGEFREDLYYRLNVLQIHLSELSERPGDVPALAQTLLAELSHETGVPSRGFAPEALEALVRHRWRGNVRELKNTIERTLFRTRGHVIELEDLPAEVGGQSRSGAPRRTVAPSVDTAAEAEAGSEVGGSLADMERAHIERVLRQESWNRSAAARTLGIDRRTLFSKIRRYGLEPSE